MKKRLGFIIATIVIIFAVFFMSSSFIIDYQWFKEVGYTSVYFTKVFSILKLFIPIFLIIFLIIYLYSRSLFNDIRTLAGDSVIKGKKIYNIIVVFVSVVFAFNIASKYWYTILQFTNSISFNEKDPLFNKDISFYVFKLPLIQVIYNTLLGLAAVLVIITIATYIALKVKFNITQINDITNVKKSKRKFAIISFVIFMMISVGFILKSYYLLYSPRGVVYGAGYTDNNITLLFNKVVTIVAAVFSFVSIFLILKDKKKILTGFAAVIVGLVILEPIAAVITQNFFVKSNELEFEKKYINYHIESTRKAYNIDSIEEKSFEPKYNLDAEQIKKNNDIISNLRINSIEPVLSFYNQVQTMKNYYNFHDIDTDRYNIDGQKSQVFVSVREIENKNITSWQNKHLIYTHGYGSVMSKVNSVTAEGQPDFLMSDLPTNNKTDIKLDNPRIYFGESSNDYIIVNTKINELDYPNGDENKGTKYSGTAGIKLTPLNRILFAINEGNSRILFSKDITNNSKIILHKNIINRVKTIAPFLKYDNDPYIVVDNGRLFWIIDAYTTSDKYPYSQPYDNVNYIRNSVKVVVDAYNGNTDFYITDDNDPIVKSYSKIFKGLFKSYDKIPATLKEHFRYPEELFKLQCEVLEKYHMTNPTTFFTQDDLWQISSGLSNSSTTAEAQVKNKDEDNKEEEVNSESKTNGKEALYLMTRLPGESKTEMVLCEYFNVMGKQNMVSMLGARMDGDNYGKLVMYKFPQQKTIYSPMLFNNKIMQDKELTKEIKLWEGKGSKVVDGDIIILPINDSLLYLKTLYLKANTENAIPEVKKIVLSDGNQIVSGDNVADALQQLFNYTADQNAPVENNNTGNTQGSTNNKISSTDAKKAKELYDNALKSQKEGDWAKYGEYIKELGNLINKLNGQDTAKE
ncbi:UPF0182 family membrane protein [Inconstantimicrobium porci]|uniref:UPF0182 protein FYJ33_11240 n=1 Tax=Inconstantimicrobium porci TaxID=2652291 RepID=A0A7X2MZJ5_9CLOT|nr:UPF0182 family protein [Inconstantimicrobium porci]MSR91954.1 hypothetical protein [Inconstantimicrobium porci]